MTAKVGKDIMAQKKKEILAKTEIAVIDITEELLRERLYEFRGRKVMLDSDLLKSRCLMLWISLVRL